MNTIGLLILIFVVFVSGAIIPKIESPNAQDELLVEPIKEESLATSEEESLATSEEVHSDENTVHNGKDPVLNILPFVEVNDSLSNYFKQHQKSSNKGGIGVTNGFFGYGNYYHHIQDKREPQVLNGFGQNQEAANIGGINVTNGHFGFGDYIAPVAHIHTSNPEVFGKREPQVLNGFGQHQEATNVGGIGVKDGHFGFGDYYKPELFVHHSANIHTTAT